MNVSPTDRIVLPNLNGLRFFAALSVIIYHVYGIGTLNGHYGVVLFFVLSGFLITYLLLTEQEKTSTINVGKFYVRRILRIWPLYYLILLLSGFLILFFFNAQTMNEYGSNLGYYIFFLPNLLIAQGTEPFPLPDILWSVASEEQFYLLWPLLLLVVPTRYLMYVLIGIVLVFTVTPHLLDYINHNFYKGSNRLIDVTSHMMQRMCFNAMATGALMSLLYKTRAGMVKRLFHPVVQVLAVVALLTLWIANYEFRYFNDEVYSILFAIIILNLAMNPDTLISFNNRFLEYLGKISYGLYVYHLTIIFLVVRYCYYFDASLTIRNSLTMVYALAGTILISAVSYEFFEKPFLRLKDRQFTVIHSGHKE